MKKYLIALVCIEMTNLSYAGPGDDPFEQQGFSGQISLFSGVSREKSNLTTDKTTKTGNLNSEGESASELMILPLGGLSYTFGKEKIFFGMGSSETIEAALEFGYGFQLADKSALLISYLFPILEGDAWADPYLVNTKREETYVSTNGFRLQYLNILNIGLEADVVYYATEVENEASGSALSSHQSRLKREGDGRYTSLSTALPLSQSTFLMPSVYLEQFSAEGDAMSFTQYGVALNIMHKIGEHAISFGYVFAESDYDKENPVFNQIQEDTLSSIHLGYNKDRFMGYQDLALRMMLSYDETESNINFYKESRYMIGVGIQYTF